MSLKNPTFREITERSVGTHYIGCKGYVTCINKEFRTRNNRWPTMDDCQELRDIFESMWVSCFEKLDEQRKEDQFAQKFYNFCVPLNIDVKKAVRVYTGGAPLPFTLITLKYEFDKFITWVFSHRNSYRHTPAKKVCKK